MNRIETSRPDFYGIQRQFESQLLTFQANALIDRDSSAKRDSKDTPHKRAWDRFTNTRSTSGFLESSANIPVVIRNVNEWIGE
jgi:hypothetical protein